LNEFPTRNHTKASLAPFWPMEDVEDQEISNGNAAPANAMEENILAQLPPVMVRGYFGPRSMRPHGHCICQRTMPSIRGNNTPRSAIEHQWNMLQNREGIISDSGVDCRTSNTVCTVSSINPFPTFDPRKDVTIGMFVAIETGNDDQFKGIPLFIAKIINM
jgi:hypothetical protein